MTSCLPQSYSRASSPLLALAGRDGLRRQVLLVCGGAAFVGLLAQLSVPMWPVAITGQTLGVMLVGAALGARRGASAMTVYLLLGLAGVSWFANFGGGASYVLSPSFGFILGFIPAAWVIGRLAKRQWSHRPLASLAVCGVATMIPFAVGVPWMWANLHLLSGQTLGVAETLEMGVIPFIPGGVLKALIAAAAMRVLWGRAHRREVAHP